MEFCVAREVGTLKKCPSSENFMQWNHLLLPLALQEYVVYPGIHVDVKFVNKKLIGRFESLE